MNVKPILFNTEMVRSILDGRKTVTRRVIKPQPKSKICYTFAGSHEKDIGRWGYPSKTAHEFWGEEFKLTDNITEEELKKKWNPPYHADDIMYVRETWAQAAAHTFFYRADKTIQNILWSPSIHMPKEAARIFLKVTSVRVERLQDIDDEQAKEEGANWRNGKNVGFEEKMRRSDVERFAEIWNATIKKSDLDRYGWDANPFVWVIEFEVCDKPELLK